ncbi:MAG: ribosome biogenesis GTP-binding protein YihA/YsxC [Cyclobacteriaceae bacterium]
MKIKTAQFVISNTDYKKCPESKIPEYAFIGRSNVGKSSLINMLTNHSKLAKTSGKPGKTQLLNHFIINDEWYLVDLPGYGWAQVSKENRNKWDKMVKDYLLYRANLHLVFVLVDSRLPPQKVDMEFINWIGEHQIPLVIVLTKTDKLSKNQVAKNEAAIKRGLKENWAELPPMFRSSAVDKNGKEEILNYIEEINQGKP